ncbi:MAG TPA: carboxy terminal-processing peptidase [Ignavibacteriales bacterium]|nr:carboxy terminal-processing peptidase [Ignavibacteriales bacterium]
MKKLIFSLIIVFLTTTYNTRNRAEYINLEYLGPDSVQTLSPQLKFSKINALMVQYISLYHFKQVEINDSLSSQIFDKYIKTLDYSRTYFYQSDIDEFENFRYTFDDNMFAGNLRPAYKIFNVYRTRIDERIQYIKQLLDRGFDFTADEYLQVDRDKELWPKNADEANELWRKRVKNEALNLILAGKEWSATRETLIKRYDNFLKAINEYDSEDVFQLFMNSFGESVDPHTSYLSPVSSDNFKISMSLSLEGIGAQLQTENDYTIIREIVPGGPAFKSGLLHVNDKITAVGQGEEGEMEDIIGWRITDVVQKIRGPKGTTVRLQIIPAAGNETDAPKTIKIIREKIKLEDQAATKDVMFLKDENNNTYKIGVITIPNFYFDYEAMQKGDSEYRSTTRDVKKLIRELQKEDVSGIVIDLRNNGGGSLQEAVELTGLFIENGPVVQLKQSNGQIEVGNDPDDQIIYKGPLSVLVNRFSASASEIFSGAIQDYGRGLIVGENTYGKGTVQNLIDLSRNNSSEKLGQLKLTTAKYYRITGSSTQHKGVVPDIEYPSVYDAKEFGESSEPTALPWDQIRGVDFTKFGDLHKVIPSLNEKHAERIKHDKKFMDYEEEVAEYKQQKEKKQISLNEEKRKKEKEESEKKRKSDVLNIADDSDAETLNPEAAAKKKDDPLLTETAHILIDLIKIADNR